MATAVVKSKRQNKESELEARIGRIENGSFRAGVSKSEWYVLLQSLDEYKGWQEINDFKTRADMFFDKGLRVTRYFSEDDDAQEPVLSIVKSKIKTADVQVGETKFMCRLCCSRETPVKFEPNQLPTFVRLKILKSFTTVSGFRFDMSQVWSATTFDEARKKSKSGMEPDFEVEIELVNADYVSKNTDIYVADSFLLKAKKLVECIASSNKQVKADSDT